MHLGPFYYFECEPRSLDNCRVAKHTKGNKDGVKTERQNIRVLSKGRFTRIESIEALYTQLFQMDNSTLKLDGAKARRPLAPS